MEFLHPPGACHMAPNLAGEAREGGQDSAGQGCGGVQRSRAARLEGREGPGARHWSGLDPQSLGRPCAGQRSACEVGFCCFYKTT